MYPLNLVCVAMYGSCEYLVETLEDSNYSFSELNEAIAKAREAKNYHNAMVIFGFMLSNNSDQA